MAYELRNGKYYKVEEVDLTNIEKEVKQAIAFIEQQKNSILPLSERVKAIELKKQQEVDKLKQEIERIELTYSNEIEAYNAEIAKYEAKILSAKESLNDKANIIKDVFPNDSIKLGF